MYTFLALYIDEQCKTQREWFRASSTEQVLGHIVKKFRRLPEPCWITCIEQTQELEQL